MSIPFYVKRQKSQYVVKSPYKETGGLRLLGGNLSPEFSSILKLAGVEGGLENNIFKGKARVFDGEQSLLDTLDGSAVSLELSNQLCTLYPNCKQAFLKDGGDFPQLSRCDEITMHLLVHLRRWDPKSST